jgi:hypothetical protein
MVDPNALSSVVFYRGGGKYKWKFSYKQRPYSITGADVFIRMRLVRVD